MTKPIITVENISKKYTIQHKERYLTLRDSVMNMLKPGKTKKEDFWALKNVSFTVNEGDVVGIIGKNGSGKSTLLKILSKITPPTEGKAIMRGRVGSLLEVGTGFNPELTGRENIYLNGAILGMKKSEITKKFDEIVEFSGVEKFLDTPVKRYSSGMYVRLAFSVAAFLETEILLVDEVLAVGDIEFQKKCLGKMGDLAKSGRTVLFVSHDMNSISSLCNKCIYLEQGQIKLNSQNVSSVTNAYLKNNLSTNKLNVYTNDMDINNKYENQYLDLIKIALTDYENKPITGQISNSADTYIQIETNIKDPVEGLNFGYAILDSKDKLLYITYQTDTEPDNWIKLEKGVIKIRSKIPKGFLNNGNYKIKFISTIHFVKWIHSPFKDSPEFNIEIQGKLSESPYWTVTRPGILAPIILWENIN